MKRKRHKLNITNMILFIIILMCLCLFIISFINIIKWKIDSAKTQRQMEKIEEIIKIEEVLENEETEIEIIEQEEETHKANPYQDYVNINLINVDFKELKSINSDTKGWLQVTGTTINYPFVQANDNKYYLTHSFDKSHNNAGWVFLDYRNDITILSKNTILYAHGRTDTRMFGSLKNTLKKKWLNNTNNHIVKISTEKENTLWQVFSIYHIPTTSDYLKIKFKSDENFTEWLSMLRKRSTYEFNTTVNKNDLVLTLSTCYNDKEKMVLHAKLIKRENK